MTSKMDCPICLQTFEENELVQKCSQCVATYHVGCFTKAQCAVCRKVFDQDLLDQKNKELMDHANQMEPADFYDEGEFYEDDDEEDVG